MGRVSQASLHPMSMQHTEHSACRHKGRRDAGEGRRREKEKEEGMRRKEGGER